MVFKLVFVKKDGYLTCPFDGMVTNLSGVFHKLPQPSVSPPETMRNLPISAEHYNLMGVPNTDNLL